MHVVSAEGMRGKDCSGRSTRQATNEQAKERNEQAKVHCITQAISRAGRATELIHSCRDQATSVVVYSERASEARDSSAAASQKHLAAVAVVARQNQASHSGSSHALD